MYFFEMNKWIFSNTRLVLMKFIEDMMVDFIVSSLLIKTCKEPFWWVYNSLNYKLSHLLVPQILWYTHLIS